ncbi:MAG: Mbeg1-like protein [Lachnospiraceae bacterium]
MNYLAEYVLETANLDWKIKGVGVEDIIVLSQLSYFKFKGVVPGLIEKKTGIQIRTLGYSIGKQILFQQQWLAKENMQLFNALKESDRFGEILLRNYSSVTDNVLGIQFAAITYELPGKVICVAFRGTDESLAGWWEDTRLAFDEMIHGQELARTYLKMVAKKEEHIDFVFGHSKGGNLAFYAVAKATKSLRQMVKRVYNLDGPGQKYKYEIPYDLKGKMVKFVPVESLVGMLYEKASRVNVIYADGIGLMQHNLYLWRIKKTQLQRYKKTRISAIHFLRGIWLTNLLYRCNSEKLEQFANWLFLQLSKKGRRNNFMAGKQD